MARIFAMITNIDANVGRLLARLQELGRERETIVVFLVDNGPNTRRWATGLRGMKGDVYEGGIRSPLLFRWPGRAGPGTVPGLTGAHIDVLPTLLEAAGISIPATLHLDGTSLLAPLLGRPRMDWGRRIFIQSHRGDEAVPRHHFAVIGRRWKLVHPTGFGRESMPDGIGYELYDLLADPGETRNAASLHPEIVNEYLHAYDAWFAEVRHPEQARPLAIALGTQHENPVVLTRQDWRHEKGRPWGSDSNGFWTVAVAEDAEFEIVLRLLSKGKGSARLEVGGRSLEAEIPEGTLEVKFSSVALNAGECTLRATITQRGIAVGPYQVTITR